MSSSFPAENLNARVDSEASAAGATTSLALADATRRRRSHRGYSAHRTPPCGSRPRWTMPGGRGGGRASVPCFIGAGPLCGCRGRGAGLKAASRRRRGMGVNSAGCAPLEVSCSLLCWSWHTNSDCSSTALLPGVEFESMMTGTHQGWARARRASGGPDASGVELDPNSCFMGCPHTVLAPKAARAGARIGANASSRLFCALAPSLCPAALHLRRDRLHSAILVAAASRASL